jgi:hypothetical protein
LKLRAPAIWQQHRLESKWMAPDGDSPLGGLNDMDGGLQRAFACALVDGFPASGDHTGALWKELGWLCRNGPG